MAELALPEAAGRRYAALDGDRSPMHLHWWSARLMGFPRPVANVAYLVASAEAAIAEARGGWQVVGWQVAVQPGQAWQCAMPAGRHVLHAVRPLQACVSHLVAALAARWHVLSGMCLARRYQHCVYHCNHCAVAAPCLLQLVTEALPA